MGSERAELESDSFEVINLTRFGDNFTPEFGLIIEKIRHMLASKFIFMISMSSRKLTISRCPC